MPIADLATSLHAPRRTLERLSALGAVRTHHRSSGHRPLMAGEDAWLLAHYPLLRALREAFRREPSVSLALLFGSQAKGQDIPQSDLDLVVDLPSGDRSALSALRDRLEQKLARPIDIFLLSDLQREPAALLAILEHARPIIDRTSWWVSLPRHRRSLKSRLHVQQVTESRARRAWAEVAIS